MRLALRAHNLGRGTGDVAGRPTPPGTATSAAPSSTCRPPQRKFKRTAEERDKLSAISMRIKTAKAKIKALSQSEEPLTIFSPARHPSSSTKQEDYRPLFHDKHGSSIATISVNGGFNREYGLEGTLDLFQFFSEENCDYPSPSKPTDKFPKTKDGTYLENLLQTANHPAPGNHLASDTKSDKLPPPPPSLLPKHLRSRESDDVTIKSDVKPTST